jgi:antitoxin component YwqK of YwqJK toxin-antitoxin module
VEGPRDAEGRLHGLIRYWDAEGRFISECEHVHGLPHGQARRFYADGSLAQECSYAEGRLVGPRTTWRPADPKLEPPRPLAQAAPTVAVYECEYEQGDLVATRFRDQSGAEVDPHGTRLPPPPPGVSPTASQMPDRGWLAMRRRGENGDEVLDMRIWYPDGQLHEEKLEDGRCRSFHPSGALRTEGLRIRQGAYKPEDGVWRYGDDAGAVRRESLYEAGIERTRTCRRPASEAGPGGAGGVMRTGPVARAGDNADAFECGRWELRGEHGELLRVLELGEPVNDRALLEDPALTDDASEEALRRRIAEGAAKEPGGAGTRLARLRLAGRTGRVDELAALSGSGPAWMRIDRDGEVIPLTHGRARLGELVHALEWGVPASEALGELAARLFRADRPRAALDLIDAARLTSDARALREARIAYLRALGREEEAARELEGMRPDRVGAHEEALLLGLRDDPADMGRWLGYAEAIAEAQPARAARIRAAYGDGGPAASEAVLEALRAELPEDLDGDVLTSGRTLWLEAEPFLAHHDALFRAAPLATELILGEATEAIAQLATLPALRRYTSLSFSDTLLFQGGAAQLARSPHLGQLSCLGLANTHLYDEDLRALLGSRAFPRLTGLDLSNYREGQSYTSDGLRALATAAFAECLEDLTMTRMWLGAELIPVLAALPRLHSLSLECGDLGDEGVLALAALPQRWTWLDLRSNDIGEQGALALGESAALAHLEQLRLGDNPLGDEGCRALVASPHLARLCVLELSAGIGNQKPPTAALGRALIDAPMASHLEELYLPGAALGTEGAQALARAPLLRLRQLNLQGNALGDGGAIALAGSEALTSLRSLDLSGNGIGDDGALALARSPHLAALEWLQLGRAEVSREAREALRARFGDRVKLDPR